jgi:hypothetical protein
MISKTGKRCLRTSKDGNLCMQHTQSASLSIREKRSQSEEKNDNPRAKKIERVNAETELARSKCDKENKDSLEELREGLKSLILEEDVTEVFLHDIDVPVLDSEDYEDSLEKFKESGISYPLGKDYVVSTKLAESLAGLPRKKELDFDEARSTSQYSSTIDAWKIFRKHGVVTDAVVKYIQDYMAEGEDEEDKIYLYANLILNQNKTNMGAQKLHADHNGEPFKEVILAVDIGGFPLKTRYLMRSHTQGSINTPQRIRGVRGTPKANCNLARTSSVVRQDKLVKYVVCESAVMLFDAGGLHGGSCVSTEADRVFFTFRRKSFHDNGAGQNDTTDVWGKAKPVLRWADKIS